MAERKEMVPRSAIEYAVKLLKKSAGESSRFPQHGYREPQFIAEAGLQIEARRQGRLEALEWVLGETNQMTGDISRLWTEAEWELPTRRDRGH